MGLTRDDNNAAYQIRAYQPGQIKINDAMFTHSIIISPEKLIEPWQPQHISELKREHLLTAAELEPAILLIGTGSHLEFPPLETYGDLINVGIGIEIMDTRAACRTYNALTAEGRNVVAALIIK